MRQSKNKKYAQYVLKSIADSRKKSKFRYSKYKNSKIKKR